MTPTMLIRVATATLVGAMFLPAQSPAEGRRPAAKASAASAAERAQVRLAEVMAMLQDDSLSPDQRAEATRKLEEVMAALAAAKATPVAGQPAQSADSAKASEEVVVVRSSRDSKSAQDSQSSSSSSSSSSSDAAKATDEQADRGGKAEAGKGKGARGMLVVPGRGAEATAPAPAQDPQPAPSPDVRFPKPPKAPKAPKPPKAPRATGALPAEAPPAPPAEGSVFEVSSLEPGTFLLSTEAPEGMTEAVAVELAEPIVISEGPGVLQFRVQSEGLQPLVIEGLEADGARAKLHAHALELSRAKLDEARQALEVDLRGALFNARRDMALAQRETEVAQRAMVEAQERMKRDIDIAAAAEGEQAAKDARRNLVLRALERASIERTALDGAAADGPLERAARERAVDRAAAERDVPPRQVERHKVEVRGQRARTRAQDEDIRALIDEMRAEMREIRSLMQEMRAHAGAGPAVGDRLHYVDERRVETTTEAIEAAKDAQRADRPIRLRWAGERVESTAPEATSPPRVRWLRAEPAPKSECEEEEVKVSTSVGVSTSPPPGGR